MSSDIGGLATKAPQSFDWGASDAARVQRQTQRQISRQSQRQSQPLGAQALAGFFLPATLASRALALRRLMRRSRRTFFSTLLYCLLMGTPVG